VARPRGYLVLPGWPQIEKRLKFHGLHVEQLSVPSLVEVEAVLLSNPASAPFSSQGLVRVSAEVQRVKRQLWVPPGSLWIPADQADFNVAAQLLEPEAPESLFAWGLLSSIFEEPACVDVALMEDRCGSLKDSKMAEQWSAARAMRVGRTILTPVPMVAHRLSSSGQRPAMSPYFRVVKAPAERSLALSRGGRRTVTPQ
jgi:hypothetical protein